jgi:hypothetical protein
MNAQLRGAVAVLIINDAAGVQKPRLYNPLKWLEMQGTHTHARTHMQAHRPHDDLPHADPAAYPFISIPVMMVSTAVGKQLLLDGEFNITLATMTSVWRCPHVNRKPRSVSESHCPTHTFASRLQLSMRTSNNLFCTTNSYTSPDIVMVGAHLGTHRTPARHRLMPYVCGLF